MCNFLCALKIQFSLWVALYFSCPPSQVFRPAPSSVAGENENWKSFKLQNQQQQKRQLLGFFLSEKRKLKVFFNVNVLCVIYLGINTIMALYDLVQGQTTSKQSSFILLVVKLAIFNISTNEQKNKA